MVSDTMPIRVVNADLPRHLLELEINNERVLARIGQDEVAILGSDGESVIARVSIGNPYSGAVYIGRDCIGEYNRRDDQYQLRPVHNGRRDPEIVLNADPVTYLLENLCAQQSRSRA